jgi:hypothetical protein
MNSLMKLRNSAANLRFSIVVFDEGLPLASHKIPVVFSELWHGIVEILHPA